MTTYKNAGARRQETPEAKRTRLADPTLDAFVEETRELQANNPTLQANLTAARKQEFENRKRELQNDIIGLQRMKDRAARGYAQAARTGYDRIYQRIERLAQVIADEFGHAVDVPIYDPPIDGRNVNTRTVQPRSASERAHDGAYRETKGMGASGKGGPTPGAPGTDAATAWLNVQGVKA